MALNSTVGDANAESYVSVSDATAYHAARGNAAWTGADSVKEIALRRGTAYLDGRYRGRWKGLRETTTQALAWPRSNATDEDGVDIAEDQIPQAVKDATCEAALRELTDQGSLQPDLDRGGDVVKEQVGPLSVEYLATAPSRTVVTVLDDLLSGVLMGGATGSASFLLRA